MAETLDAQIEEIKAGKQRLNYEGLKGRDTRDAERLIDGFVEILRRMTPEERIRASRHGGYTRWERWVWAARYPEEVPLVNGELEWIAFGLADID